MKKYAIPFIIYAVSLWSFSVFGSQKESIDTLKKARWVIERIDYLPFTSKSDGCYARALYMGMELAIYGIPATNQYVFGNLRPGKNLRWKYHVAPMVAVDSPIEYAVFDPSLNGAPMSRQQWVRFNRPQGTTELYVSPASHYLKSQVQALNQQQKRGYSLNSRVKRVRRLPRYNMEDIADACETAWEHIGLEKNLSRRQRSRKKQRLEQRTQYLMKRLKQLGLLAPESQLLQCSDGRYTS